MLYKHIVNSEGSRQGKIARAAVMFAIADFIEIHGYSPTVREISDAIGLSSTDTIQKHLKQLQASGYISSVEKSPRTIVIALPYIYCAKDQPWFPSLRKGVKKKREYFSRGWRRE